MQHLHLEISFKFSSSNQNPPKQRKTEKKQKKHESLFSNLDFECHINIKIARQGKIEITSWVIYNPFNEEISLIKETIKSHIVK